MKNDVFPKENENRGLTIEHLMTDYMGFVYSIVRKRLYSASAEDIEETVSDVFVRLYNSLDSFDPAKSSIKTYIGIIAKNTATDRYRQLKNLPASEERDENTPSDAPSLCDEVIRREEREAVFDALMLLKEPDRTIVFRRFYLDETFESIGTAVRRSPNAVQKRLKRALKKLEERLRGKI